MGARMFYNDINAAKISRLRGIAWLLGTLIMLAEAGKKLLRLPQKSLDKFDFVCYYIGVGDRKNV